VLVGLLGAGHIARALAEGWRRPELETVRQPELLSYDVDPSALAAFAGDFGVLASGSPAELVAGSELVVLAVRPPDVPALLAGVGPALGRRPLVSLAAFVTLDDLRGLLPDGAQVCRVMPNVAAAVGQGVFLFAAGTLQADAGRSVEGLFALAGDVVPLAETQFDAATAVAGCGPGFTALFVEALAQAGVGAGLETGLATRLAADAVAGSAALAARDGDPAGLRRAVATPGGMTAAGVEVLEQKGMREMMSAAVNAAVERASRRS